MSEVTKNTKTENAPNIVISKPSKQKHNSKRRRPKKNKAFIELNDGLKMEKVDQVVNYLCSTLGKNDFETSLKSNFPKKIANEIPKIVGVSSVQNHSQNSKFYQIQKPLSSTNDLSNLFENIKMHTSNNPIQSSNINDILNNDLLKKTQCESLCVQDLEILKQKKLKKNCTLNVKKISIPNEIAHVNLDKVGNSAGTSVLAQIDPASMQLVSECKKNVKKISIPNEIAHVNLNKVGNSAGTSVLAQIDPASMQLVSEIEQTFPKIENKLPKSKYLNKYFNVDASAPEKNNLESKLLVKELENMSLKCKTQEGYGKPQIKKAKRKKNDEPFDEKKFFNCNQRVFLNSDLQKTFSSERMSSKPDMSRKKKPNLKSSITKNDTEFPNYLSSEELQSVSHFGVLLTGIIRINQKNYKEAYIIAPDKGMDILIEGLRDRNRALEGDEVYFVLKPKEHHRVNLDSPGVQRTAVVVGIKSLNHNRGAIGILNPIKNNNNFALFSPRDSRLPRIRIKKSSWPIGFSDNSNEFKNKLYFAKISQWNNVRFADGEIVKEVGIVGNLEAETDAILLKYGLDVTPYNESLKQYIPPSTFRISETDMLNREDFRKDCIFTIDPQTAVDLDDAVSCKPLPNGNFEVGIHISDVSYFLKEGTPLDKIVSERATTIYLVQKAYHMLPFELCRLCSLTPGEDKLSFSVLWEVTPDCRIISHRFVRSVINSCAQFSYDQVQAIIDNSPSFDSALPKIHGGHKSENIKKVVMFLHKIAVCLRNKRFRNGALRIDQKKIYFSLDENKLPLGYKEEIHEPSHQLIEELMLLANITVAEKLNSSFPELAFLRSHPPPLPYVLDKIQKNLEKYGIILDISSSGSVQASLSKYAGNDTESVARMLVLNNALTKPMARAKYYCRGLFSEESDRRHYALNVPLYSHFTSPIRRYADIMVHRLLAASLRYCDSPNWKPEYVQFIASNCNKQKYAAKMAQEMSVELYFALYIGLQGTVVCEAVVCDIKDKSFDCIGLSTGIHQRIYFENIKGELKREKEDGISRLIIKWPKDETHNVEIIEIIEMFSIVMIELKRASVLKIEAKLLRNQ